ncbi:tripartite tricarboxylate transporter substrate binding protein [Epidermidibacterium keratini]|uniref:Tripartite tricarboxylate transporter substrate binding protein n=1 Tax=Epidermidibacterium keratini TaxID=1891644 RepID=A0A7L4YIG9_9ACTN|nr:tripartite tricarboxylate transporter substrate binding protein [Epidermidibacterium keratini]QHB99214.1 tripartite tricarboxylate transporter substrate binding protein [Epidermidibacterium keratini]
MAGKTRVAQALGVVVVLVLAIFAVLDARGESDEGGPSAKLTLVAPAAVGGGWDLVAREAQQALRSDAISTSVSVVNVPGAGGTIGLSQLVGMEGDGQTMMVMGTVMLGGIVQAGGNITLADTTPIARLAEDFEVIAVPADSPYETLDDFLADWKNDPASIPIGGGSAGGIDHLVAAQLAKAAGIDPAQLHYTPHSGGGELTQSLTSTASGTVNIGISGYNDFRDLIEGGKLRALAIVAPEPVEGIDVPTMIELGYPEVDLVNWRGFVAPPGISEDERAQLVQVVKDMVATDSWAEAVELNKWQENYADGSEFEDFIASEQERIAALMEELELV